jgi:hypothetical protein
MILNYLDLEGKPLMVAGAKGKPIVYKRVRWQHPELHKSLDGKSPKYKSPAKTGNQLWLPNAIIQAFADAMPYETLVVTEGEKKADKLCQHGIMAVGISGIYNLSFDGMTNQLEQIIRKAGVKNVLFGMDADWKDLGKDGNVDARPRQFAGSVIRFRDYFMGYKNSGLDLNIFWMYGKDYAYKGFDDLLSRGLQGDDRAKLKGDIERAMIDRQGIGTYVDCHNITFISQHKIYEFWKLHSPQAFMQFYEKVLQEKKEFVYHKQRWRWNPEADGGKFEMIEKILEAEKFWTTEEIVQKDGGTKKKHSFLYYQCLQFLGNRGFGLFELPKNEFRWIRTESKIVRETTPHHVQQYIKDFLEDLEHFDILELMLRGSSQYLGPNTLSQLKYIRPEFVEPEKDAQILVFKNCYWKITANGITQGTLNELPKSIWNNRMIDFDPNLPKKPLVTVTREHDKWKIGTTSDASKSDMWNFFQSTSNFWWEKEQQIVQGEAGMYIAAKEKTEKMTASELNDWKTHVVSKMIASGYVLHEYKNKAQMKALVCMDGLESEVGKSMGGSGKSIFATMFEKLLPTVVIDGKKKDMSDDKHLYDSVDERTRIIVYDDCRVNFDFEALFSQITRGVEVNQKGNRKFTIPAPKFIISTNHALNGSDDSHMRRQYMVSFSNYFNRARTPQDQFGRLMFDEWDYEQWNLFYNLMATCIQVYMQFSDLNKYTIPTVDLERRKLRQQIGENYLEFASLYFSAEAYRNKAIHKDKVTNDYLESYPQDRKYMNNRTIKEKTALYSKYSKLFYNPCAGADGRVKFGKDEYLVVADDLFDKNSYDKIDE